MASCSKIDAPDANTSGNCPAVQPCVKEKVCILNSMTCYVAHDLSIKKLLSMRSATTPVGFAHSFPQCTVHSRYPLGGSHTLPDHRHTVANVFTECASEARTLPGLS